MEFGWNDVGSVATAIGLAVTALQVYLGTEQSKTAFEDGLTKEYRELLAGLPQEITLQQSLADERVDEYFPLLYRYFDLCNEQAYLRSKERIRPDTWREWSTGIRANLARPGFRAAWQRIKSETSSFAELRCVERIADDPVTPKWRAELKRVEVELSGRIRRDSVESTGSEMPVVESGGSVNVARRSGVDE